MMNLNLHIRFDEMPCDYAQFLVTLNQARNNGLINMLHRGEDIVFAYSNFNLDTSINGIEQYAERLFFFGDKARYFWNNKLLLNKNLEIDFELNDTSAQVFTYIFRLFNELIKTSERAETLLYLKKNKNATSFFSDLDNVEFFIDKVEILPNDKKLFYRNYYLKLIHQLVETVYNKNSAFVSSSKKKKVAMAFSENGIIINFWTLCNSNQHFFVEWLPRFIGEPYKDQNEVSIFGAVFPHYIYSFEFKGVIYPNPNLFTNQDFNSVIFNGFEINQDYFLERLKKESKYSKGLLTDGERFEVIN